MAVGDIILIPSQGSNLIEFGVLQSDAYTYHVDITDLEEGQCDYVKRRDVLWLHREKRDKLDPYLYGLIYSQHAISSANEYAHYIDRAMNKFYIKGDTAHIVFEVTKQNKISGTELIKLINTNLDLIEKFNNLTGSKLDKDKVQIKINVQSPGLIELFGYTDEIVIIALLVTAILGGKISLFKVIEFETPGLLEMVKQFIERHQNYDLEKEKIALQRAQLSLQVKNPPELQISSQEGESDESVNN